MSITYRGENFPDTINLSELVVNLRSLPYSQKKETKFVLCVLEIPICPSKRTYPHGVNPSERDISAMKRSLN